jgi:hypothetical protein
MQDLFSEKQTTRPTLVSKLAQSPDDVILVLADASHTEYTVIKISTRAKSDCLNE